MRTAIFDLDGTLADTSGDLIAAANHCFEAEVLDPVRDAVTAFAGGRAMLRLGYQRLGTEDEAAVEAAYPRFLDFYDQNINVHTTVYEGVELALDALADRGWALGICTNKPVAMADKLMDRLSLRQRFVGFVGAGSLPVSKPDPAPLLEAIRLSGGDAERSVLIGDTITDARTGKAAGVPCVLVTFGPDGPDVARHAPDALLDEYGSLPKLLDQMISA